MKELINAIGSKACRLMANIPNPWMTSQQWRDCAAVLEGKEIPAERKAALKALPYFK